MSNKKFIYYSRQKISSGNYGNLTFYETKESFKKGCEIIIKRLNKFHEDFNEFSDVAKFKYEIGITKDIEILYNGKEK